MEYETVRKITTAIFGKCKDQAARKIESMSVMLIIGIVDNYVEETSQYGEFYRLYGDFMAIDEMGVKPNARSDCAILPAFLGKKLVAAITEKTTGEMMRVEFKLKIGTRPNADSITGYEFTAEPLDRVEPHEDRLLIMAGAHAKVLEHKPADKKVKSI